MLFCFTVLNRRSSGQDILTGPPQVPAVPSAVVDFQAGNPMQVFSLLDEVPAPTPLQYGPVAVHPHLDYQFLYGNGIEFSPGRSQATSLQTFAPGVLSNLGDHWTVDYTPTLSFYSSRSFQNTVNQSARLSWGTSYGGDWTFSGSQSYNSSSNPNVETAEQTGQDIYITSFNATYQVNTAISLDFGVNQDLNYVTGAGNTTNLLVNLEDTMGWATTDWVNYQFWPRFNIGLGAGLGYNEPASSPSSLYELYQGRVNWRATDKISFQLNGGLDDQQYLSGGANALLTPIFGASVQYQPFEQTQLGISASRAVSQSIFQNQASENTAVNVSLNQRLLGKFQLALSVEYGTTQYIATESGLATSRSDDLFSFNLRLSCPLVTGATASLVYTYTDNSSQQSGFASAGSQYAFSSSQVGFEIGYRF